MDMPCGIHTVGEKYPICIRCPKLFKWYLSIRNHSVSCRSLLDLLFNCSVHILQSLDLDEAFVTYWLHFLYWTIHRYLNYSYIQKYFLKGSTLASFDTLQVLPAFCAMSPINTFHCLFYCCFFMFSTSL